MIQNVNSTQNKYNSSNHSEQITEGINRFLWLLSGIVPSHLILLKGPFKKPCLTIISHISSLIGFVREH